MTKIDLETIRARLSARRPRRIVESGTIQAAVALVLAPGDDQHLDLLLIKRAARSGDPWSGQMALPGGRRDETDHDLFETATRETAEETGIRLTSDVLLGELDDLHPRTRVLPPIVVRPFVFGLSAAPPVHASDEVALHVWVPLAAFPKAHREVDLTVRGEVRREPSYVVGEQVVWGMTQRILKPFIELML